MSNMYESGSLPSHFKPHQQGPKGLPATAFGRAAMPVKEVESERASYVLINVGHATKYEFLYESGGAYESFGIVPIASNAGAGPIRVDINPIAWKGGGEVLGDVTFVYRGGL